MRLTRTARFWNWFRERESQYRMLEQCKPKEVEQRIYELDVHLMGYHRHLAGIVERDAKTGKWKLVITANGRAFSFPMAERLASKAPVIKEWEVLALDYPRAPGFSLDKYFPQVSIDPQRLWFLPWTLEEPTPGKVDIVVYSELYNCFEEKRQYKLAVYRILYNILGERSFALDLGRVDLGNVSEVRRRKKLKPLEELPGYIEGSVSCGLMVGSGGELKNAK